MVQDNNTTCPFCGNLCHMNVSDRARATIAKEDFDEKVEQYKQKLREKKSLFPWRIKFINVNK